VREYPERGIDTLVYKDVQKHESEMRLIEKQLPQGKAFYDAQTPEARVRIDRDLDGVKRYYQDKAFVSAVLREKDRQERSELTVPKAAPASQGRGGGLNRASSPEHPPHLDDHLGQVEFALKVAANFECLKGTPAHDSVRSALAQMEQARTRVREKLAVKTTIMKPYQAPLGQGLPLTRKERMSYRWP
jgi:hypothetical protein